MKNRINTSFLFSRFILLFSVLLSSQVIAQCPAQTNLTQNSGGSIQTHSRVGQSFTATCSGNITTVTVVYNTIPPSSQDRVLKIRDGDLPTSPVLHSQVIPYNSIVLGENIFTISAPVPMNALEVNAWEITDATNSGFAADGISLNSSGAYPSGGAWFVPFAPAGYDLTFAVQVGPVCVTSIGTDTRTECGGLVWLDGLTYTSDNNTASYSMPSGAVNGCDSLVLLDLIILNGSVGTDVRTECNSLIWIDGLTYTSDNTTATYTIIGGAVNGCDSLVTLDLTIINSVTGTDTRTECDSLVWIDGMTYLSTNTTATDTIVGGASNGCDSIVTLDLTIINSVSGVDTRTECSPLTWIDGIVYSSSNTTATHTISGGAANGCDSLVMLNLTVYTPSGIDTRTTCDSLVWIDGLTYYSNNNTATFNLVGAAINGCDSLVTLNLTVNSVNTGVTQNGLTLTSNATNVTYEWLDCNINYAPIGVSSQTYTPTANGSYAVQINDFGCLDTSTCTLITIIGVEEYNSYTDVNIFPNPTNGLINIESFEHVIASFIIYNTLGQQVYSKANINGKVYQVEVDMKSGIYIVELTIDANKKRFELVIE